MSSAYERIEAFEASGHLVCTDCRPMLELDGSYPLYPAERIHPGFTLCPGHENIRQGQIDEARERYSYLLAEYGEDTAEYLTGGER